MIFFYTSPLLGEVQFLCKCRNSLLHIPLSCILYNFIYNTLQTPRSRGLVFFSFVISGTYILVYCRSSLYRESAAGPAEGFGSNAKPYTCSSLTPLKRIDKFHSLLIYSIHVGQHLDFNLQFQESFTFPP